jgi:dsRNA-specific ribonuclease
VSARKVAEAWYGRRVPGSVVHAMADRIEALGLARRDDERRGSLWVLAPDETERFADEAELEAELKRDNPKGRLFELCMRMRIAPPLIEIEVEGAFHVATMRVVIGGEVIASGGQRAASRKAAVQLAARELLEVLEQRRADAEAAVTRLDDDAAAALQQRNPKGRLLEWFAGRHLPGPTFEHKAMADGYAARALCRIGERAIEGGWFGARSRKLAEHAAADALMAELPGDAERDADAGDADAGAADAGASGSSEFRGKVEAGGKAGGQAAVATDARMVLNEMRQSGAIVDFGYELRAQQGPSHQPLFVVEAWAQAPSGERIRDCQGEARSKKDAQRIAAAALLERIHSLQIER